MSAGEAVRKLWRNTRGAALLEFTLVAWIFFVAMMGVVEFSYYMWQYNAVSKAAQAGLRYAVVSDPVARDAPNLVPGSAITVTCQTNADATATTCSSGQSNHEAMMCIWQRVRRFSPLVEARNLVIEYRANALGVPGTNAPTIGLRLVDFEFPTFFFGFMGGRLLPALNYTMTAEDMSSSPPGQSMTSNPECVS